MQDKKRIAWVDLAKGMAMILVIVGHTVGNIPVVISIYSFHMPLFFILSGYTTTCSQNGAALVRRLKRTFFSLFLLAEGLFLLQTALDTLRGQSAYTLRQILAAGFWANGESFTSNGMMIPTIGKVWFLIDLFFLRNLYDALHLLTKGRHMTALSLAITALAVAIGQWMYLPFALDRALVSFVFFDFGQRLKNCKLQPTVPRCVGLSFAWGGVPDSRTFRCAWLFHDEFTSVSARPGRIFMRDGREPALLPCLYRALPVRL